MMDSVEATTILTNTTDGVGAPEFLNPSQVEEMEERSFIL